MGFIPFTTSRDIYIEINGQKIAAAQSYQAKSTKESRYVEAFGSAEPVGTVGDRVRHVLELTRVAVHSPSVSSPDFHTASDFNIVITLPDRKITYSGCQWSSISEAVPSDDLVYETLTAVASTRTEVKN